jgi:hypothetical protein
MGVRLVPGTPGCDAERKRMSEAPDTELQDEQMVEEIHLVTELMVLASMTSGELDQEVIDNALGIDRATRPFPTQRTTS